MAIELTPTPEAVLVEGAVGCGKTTRLVERAAALLEGGAAPSDLLVLAATPDAARMLAARLEAACGATVEATCVREVALGLLPTEGGRAFSDRAGRLVTPVEMGFIMEDMKTCGLKNRRLKEMLKFFYRSWTELVEDADGNADWLLAGEEADVHGLLKGILDFTGGILEPELSALAVRYLLADGEALAGAQRAHVLVDDYQMLSRASQHVANLLARDSIAVAADPAAVVEVFDSYPYGEGVGEFTQANADCERIVLTESHACGAAAHAASRLREDAAPGAPEITGVGDAPATDSFTARESADPAAEVAAVAEAVEAALGAGCAPRTCTCSPSIPPGCARSCGPWPRGTLPPPRPWRDGFPWATTATLTAAPRRGCWRPWTWQPTPPTLWPGAPGAASATIWPTAPPSPICGPGPPPRARASWRCWRRRRPPRPPRASRTRASAASWTPTAPGASSSPRCRAWKVTGCWTPSRPASAWKATGRRGRGPSSVPSRPRPPARRAAPMPRP